jgi:hypothetical protein
MQKGFPIVLILMVCLAGGCRSFRAGAKDTVRHLPAEYADRVRSLYSASSSNTVFSVEDNTAKPVDAKVQDAIRRATSWLQQHRNATGSWEGEEPTLTAAFALLLFDGLANRQQAQALCDQLIGLQSADGSWRAGSKHLWPITQAMAVFAISRHYEQFPSPVLAAAVTQGAAVILRNQQSDGGWAYSYESSQYRNTLVAACQVLALQAVNRAGIAVPRLGRAMVMAANDILSVQERESGIVGSDFRGFSGWNATGEGLLVLQCCGLADTDEAFMAKAVLQGLTKGWVSGSRYALLDALLNELALRRSGSREWQSWHEALRQEVLAHQDADGSWGATPSEMTLGSAYATVLCSLILLVGEALDLNPAWQDEVKSPPCWLIEGPVGRATLLAAVPCRTYDVQRITPAMWRQYDEAEQLVLSYDLYAVRSAAMDWMLQLQPASRAPLALRRNAAKFLDVPVPAVNDISAGLLAGGLVDGALTRARMELDGLAGKIRYVLPIKTRQVLLNPRDFWPVALELKDDWTVPGTMLKYLTSSPDPLERMRKEWAQGVLPAYQSMDSVEPQANLLRQKSLERLLKMMKNGNPCFVVADFWLLQGEGNWLDALKQRGYTVTRQ